MRFVYFMRIFFFFFKDTKGYSRIMIWVCVRQDDTAAAAAINDDWRCTTLAEKLICFPKRDYIYEYTRVWGRSLHVNNTKDGLCLYFPNLQSFYFFLLFYFTLSSTTLLLRSTLRSPSYPSSVGTRSRIIVSFTFSPPQSRSTHVRVLIKKPTRWSDTKVPEKVP